MCIDVFIKKKWGISISFRIELHPEEKKRPPEILQKKSLNL